MQYITGIDAHQWTKPTAVTLGKFDGLHRGHQTLVDKICGYADSTCESVVCAFDMDRESIMTKRERREMLEEKVDYLVEYPFTAELRDMEAEVFIREILSEKLHAAHIVVGSDFCFGHGKRGNVTMLAQYAKQYGYTLDVIEKKKLGDRVISSTYVKEALTEGNVKLAEELLGYPYRMTGVVQHGQQLGRTLGFPTMNIEPEERKILPRFGVYACRVEIDGIWYRGVGNAGIKPTVTNERRRLMEVYVYDYSGDAYGKEITVEFVRFQRPETKFGSVEELRAQVMRDMKEGRE